MGLKFTLLKPNNLRELGPGEKITEHFITAERLRDGDIRFSVNTMVDGRRIHRTIGRKSDGTTRTQCEQFLERVRTDARKNRLELPEGRKLHLTFYRAADEYLDKLKEVDGKEYYRNEMHLRLHLKPFFKDTRLDKICDLDIARYRKRCIEKGLSPSTINRTLATFRRMARRLVAWGITTVELPRIKLSREENHREYVLSRDEEKRLLDAASMDSNLYVELFIKLGLATSLRQNEILTARFEGFDSERHHLRVKVKGGTWRNQPLTRGTVEILKREREMAEDPEGWIFPSKRSERGHIEQMNRPVARCAERAGLDPHLVTPHCFRHTAITRFSATGADIKSTQEFSGHKSWTALKRYVHRDDAALRSALDKMERGTVLEHSELNGVRSS